MSTIISSLLFDRFQSTLYIFGTIIRRYDNTYQHLPIFFAYTTPQYISCKADNLDIPFTLNNAYFIILGNAPQYPCITARTAPLERRTDFLKKKEPVVLAAVQTMVTGQ